jgi:Lrp/AsnC family leucine-responsive transcriptional regulator
MERLDRKDREILHQLDVNARQTNSQMAKKVRASKEVVAYRIRRMVNEGVIQGFYVLVDMTKLGYLNARIFIKMKNVGPEEEREATDFFNKSSRCWWVNSISGSFTDMGIAFWVKDINDFHGFKESLLNRYGSNVEFYRESFYSKIHIWRRSYLSGKNEQRRYDLILGSSQKVDFDDYDIKLLANLSENARLPLVELAGKVGLSITATRHRLENLKRKNIILGFRPKIDFAKIGHYWYKVEFRLEDNSAKGKMLAYFSSHPNIVYAYETIGGGTELEMEMEVESHEKFREIVDEIRDKFKDSIRTYAYYLWSAEHKLVYFPHEEFFRTK